MKPLVGSGILVLIPLMLDFTGKTDPPKHGIHTWMKPFNKSEELLIKTLPDKALAWNTFVVHADGKHHEVTPSSHWSEMGEQPACRATVKRKMQSATTALRYQFLRYTQMHIHVDLMRQPLVDDKVMIPESCQQLTSDDKGRWKQLMLQKMHNAIDQTKPLTEANWTRLVSVAQVARQVHFVTLGKDPDSLSMDKATEAVEKGKESGRGCHKRKLHNNAIQNA